MPAEKMVELNFSPDERTLRHFGFIALAGFGVPALCAHYEVFLFAFGLGEARMNVVAGLATAAVLSALSSLIYPKANRVLFVAVSVAAYPIGFVMSYVILGLLFFGVFAPIGLLLRLSGHDPMRRGFEADRPSYWTEACGERSKASYFRQF